MRVPASILNCVCFLCVKFTEGRYAEKYQSAGTGFFIGVSESGVDFGYLVTARHVIDEAKRLGFDWLYVRLNKHDGGYGYIQIGLECGRDWAVYTNNAIDVAVAPFMPDLETFYLEALPVDMLATNEKIDQHNIGLGDDLFVTGLFALREGKQRNIPILRTGVISAMPVEPLLSKDGGEYHAYLAEMRSIGGLSGSPVFVFISKNRVVDSNIPDGGDYLYFLLGLIRGHWDLKVSASDALTIDDNPFIGKGESLNVGIAIVTPAQYIVNMVLSEHLQAQRKKAVMELGAGNAPADDSMTQEPAGEG